MFTIIYDFDKKPHAEEVYAVRQAIERIKDGRSRAKVPAHLFNSNDYIAKEVAHGRPRADQKAVSRIVFLSQRIIRDEDFAARGFRPLTIDDLIRLHAAGKRLIVHLDGLFASSDVEVRPAASDAWLPKGNRTRGYRTASLIGKYAKTI